MKTLKIIFSIFFLLVIPLSTWTLSEYGIAIQEVGNAITDFGMDNGTSGFTTVHLMYQAIAILAVLNIPLLISAAVVGLSAQKKYYGSLIAGGIPLIPLIWMAICTIIMAGLRNHDWVSLTAYYTDEYYTALYPRSLEKYALLIMVPTVGHLIIGIIETKKFRRRLMMGLPEEAFITSINNVVPTAQPASTVEELKQYKELLDMGIITPEEFEAKKKQLLGLPNTYSAPSAPQNLGKCVVCGCENIPVESVEVVVAGMSRKRTMCTACAAKYK